MIKRISALGVRIRTYDEGTRTLILALAIFIALAAWWYHDATSPRMGSVDWLSYRIEMVKQEYLLGEAPELRIYMVNERKHPVYIERVSRIGSTFLVAITKDGKRFISQIACPHLGYTKAAHEAKALERMLMKPGEAHLYTFNLSDYEWFDQESFGEFDRELEYLKWEPGNYSVEVYYVQRCSRCHYEIKSDQYKWLGSSTISIKNASAGYGGWR